MVVDFHEPVGPVIKMIPLSALVACSIESLSCMSAGLGIIQGIILIDMVMPLIVRDILIRNLAPHCEYDVSSVLSSNFLPRRYSQILSISNPVTTPYLSTGTIFHILFLIYGNDSLVI